ncbi:MAG: hypothetical protein J0H74_21360 [Chitinophagaceae bacterium]|nr:hypothetical protein [Chitinophagaceae bacterium]
MKQLLILVFIVFGVCSMVCAQGRTSVSLNGEWTFAIDPVGAGESEKWYMPDVQSDRLDKVEVPHCFSVDKRYEFYTGKAWYFKRFSSMSFRAGERQFLHFDAVFYRSRVWLNGERIGDHEGGYTPFELDVTGKLGQENVLAVEVDNSWDTTTIPGAKTSVAYQASNVRQQYPWINYGGITRPVSVITRPDLFIRNIKVSTDPDLKKGTALIRIRASIANFSKADGVTAGRVTADGVTAGGASVRGTTIGGRIFREGKPLTQRLRPVPVKITPGAEGAVYFETVLSAGEVALWDQDHPHLYKAELYAGQDTMSVTFGIRKLELRDGRLLLNGESVRMGGANRPLDHPDYGSMDPAVVLDKDLSLMKAGCMEMSRINHYPVPEYLLDWADRNGLLIIEEAGNWQMTPRQMSDTMMRRKWQSQMREMVERDWNHPCIFSWSVGNEFQSQTAEGKSWVKDMSAFTRAMDSTRYITFASMIVFRDNIKAREDEASQYVDFISANIYGNHLKNIQHIHEVYPDKAIFLSEFGLRADQVKDEGQRVTHLKDAMAAFRACDYVIGACVWTFQDYRSRFPGSNPNGYRPWGLVTPQREPRGMYDAWQSEFSPATMEAISGTGKLTLRVTARKDFPSYTLKDYTVSYNGRSVPLRMLRPGESQELTIDAGAGTKVSLVKPGGFVILTKTF